MFEVVTVRCYAFFPVLLRLLKICSGSLLSPYTWELPLKPVAPFQSENTSLSAPFLWWSKRRNCWEPDLDCRLGVIPLWHYHGYTMHDMGCALSWFNFHFPASPVDFWVCDHSWAASGLWCSAAHWRWFSLDMYECIMPQKSKKVKP